MDKFTILCYYYYYQCFTTEGLTATCTAALGLPNLTTITRADL